MAFAHAGGCARKILIVAVAALVGSSALAQDRPNPFKSEAIDRLVYGVYCTEAPIELEEAPGTAAGVVNIMPQLPQMLAETTLVPAQIGIGFGVLVDPRSGLGFDVVDVTITHPPYRDSEVEVERWVTTLEADATGLIGFSFEMDSELVTGPWSFEARQDGDLLFRIDFEVVPPALLLDLAQACSGAILS